MIFLVQVSCPMWGEGVKKSKNVADVINGNPFRLDGPTPDPNLNLDQNPDQNLLMNQLLFSKKYARLKNQSLHQMKLEQNYASLKETKGGTGPCHLRPGIG